MKTATPIPPILTLHLLAPGQYVVRIGDLQYRSQAVAVAKSLEDASTLVLITPADIKILRVSGTSARGEPGNGRVASRPGDAEAAADSQPEVPMESLDSETQAAIREQEGHAPPGLPPAEQVAEAGMQVVRRKPNGRPAAGHPETCGRCRGLGKIRIIDEGGGPGEATCGVCQGEGVVTRYGLRH